MNESQFKVVSLGIVVEDKPLGSEYIKVTPIEEFYDQPSGIINNKEGKMAGDVPSLDEGGGFDTEHTATNVVRARWLSFGSGNRQTPPDVCRNEKVVLYRYGDTEEYYWVEHSRSPGMRGKELALYSWSNKFIGGVDEQADEGNSVVFVVDTKTGNVKLTTPKNNGEPAAYSIVINMSKGNILIEDDLGNKMELDSPSGRLEATTNESIILNTKDYTLNCETSTINCNAHVVNASDQVTHATPMVENTSNQHTMGQHDVDGVVNCAGIGVGGSGSSGSATINGTTTINGAQTTNGSTTTNGNNTVNGDLTVTGSATGSFPGPKA